MNITQSVTIALLCSAFSATSFAGSALSEIKISDDILYFSTRDNQSVNASCILPANSGIWAVSMNSATGKNAYLALMTAASTGQKVTVTSANDCSDADGYERPASVAIDGS